MWAVCHKVQNSSFSTQALGIYAVLNGTFLAHTHRLIVAHSVRFNLSIGIWPYDVRPPDHLVAVARIFAKIPGFRFGRDQPSASRAFCARQHFRLCSGMLCFVRNPKSNRQRQSSERLTVLYAVRASGNTRAVSCAPAAVYICCEKKRENYLFYSKLKCSAIVVQ